MDRKELTTRALDQQPCGLPEARNPNPFSESREDGPEGRGLRFRVVRVTRRSEKALERRSAGTMCLFSDEDPIAAPGGA